MELSSTRSAFRVRREKTHDLLLRFPAPLVRCSKLPFRHLVSLYNTHITTTPMILAAEVSLQAHAYPCRLRNALEAHSRRSSSRRCSSHATEPPAKLTSAHPPWSGESFG